MNLILACVYILYSSILDKFHTGSSRNDDQNSRLKAHNAGETRSTKSGRPWIILYKEIYFNYSEARKEGIS